MVSSGLLRELEGIVDQMVESENTPLEIIDCCKDAVIESLSARNKPISEKLKRLSIPIGTD